ncbi:MAG: hypothetical protein C5B55_08195 [Blastocatellia bacterium]|nr:MAG: hypothetical protein C5B55_08195 [Blastocatellia bacterium]
MVDITIVENNVIFEVHGWDKVWSLRSQLTISLSHIKHVHADPEPAMGWLDGLKIAGAAVPNIFRAGTFYQQGELVFWDVRHPENTIVIELSHERYKKLIIEVANPQAEVQKISTALRASNVE